ncbi:alpha/beta hydrolase [Bradyrhizobium sp.]|uniref:alpha/beta hydrolase n=1 Tax=Bradyrhizobium sp. TaxID=376 RepID=UPI0026156D7D|nr:alpha/beta hydrolase [Bradyrhizobium sp.]
MATPFDVLDWRKLSREALDSGLNNSAAVDGSADTMARWEKLSADMRARHSAHLDLPYGPRERNRVDFLKAAPNAPTLLFIHGGYWQTRSKDVFTRFAEGAMAHGINVALIGYTLAPDATLEEIVAEIHAGIDYLAGRLPELGADASRLIASGWSAGGHLTAMAMLNPHIKGGIAISGIYDLEPIRHSYLNDKLGLDEAMSKRNSPMLLTHPVKPMALIVGGAELPLLRKQTADFASYRASHGLPVTYEEIPGANHFTIMDEMASPAGRITAMIRQVMERV